MTEQQKDTISDVAVATVKASVGVAAAVAATNPVTAPFAICAPGVIEFLNVVLPPRRRKRVDNMVDAMAERDPEITPQAIIEKINASEEFAGIFERAAMQAAEAKTKERIAAIAGIVASQFHDSARSHEADKCLSLVEALDDFDLFLFLCMYQAMPDKRENYGPYNTAFRTEMLARKTNLWFLGSEDDFNERYEKWSKWKTPLAAPEHNEMALNSLQKMENLGLIFRTSDLKAFIQSWAITKMGYLVHGYIQGRGSDVKIKNDDGQEATKSGVPEPR